jgi:1-deoxy-D-xylulose 5-phosphate reductoisomerase
MQKKFIAVLGATGTIGRGALDVVRSFPEVFTPVLFTANGDA